MLQGHKGQSQNSRLCLTAGACTNHMQLILAVSFDRDELLSTGCGYYSQTYSFNSRFGGKERCEASGKSWGAK